MPLAEIIGRATATVKHSSMDGWRMLIAQPLGISGQDDERSDEGNATDDWNSWRHDIRGAAVHPILLFGANALGGLVTQGPRWVSDQGPFFAVACIAVYPLSLVLQRYLRRRRSKQGL